MMIQKSMTYYTESYKIAFLATVFLISAVAIYRWFVVPHKNYLEAAQNYDSTISALNSKKQIISNNLETSRLKHNKINEQFAILKVQLFDSYEEREFFSNIEVFCRQVGCKMLSLTFTRSSANNSKSDKNDNFESDYVSSSPVSLIVKGRYPNLVALMNKLQGDSKLVRINPVNINSDKENPGYLTCTMTITIYVTNKKKVVENDV